MEKFLTHHPLNLPITYNVIILLEKIGEAKPMEFERILKLNPIDHARLIKMCKDYIRLKNPEWQKAGILEDQTMMAFAESIINKIE